MNKKVTVLMMAVLMTAMFSCRKDTGTDLPSGGVNNGVVKISEIWSMDSSLIEYPAYDIRHSDVNAKHLALRCTWEGEKLAKVEYYNAEGIMTDEATLVYEGDKLMQVTNSGEGNYRTYSYQGDKLMRVEEYEGGTKKIVLDYYYNGAKVTKLLRTLVGAGEGGVDVVWTKSYEYEGNNVKKITQSNNALPDDVTVDEYEYDSKLNPYYGMMFFVANSPSDVFSENNTVTQLMTAPGGTQSEMTWTYEYSGDLPTTSTSQVNDQTESYNLYKMEKLWFNYVK
jgi:hypothetical protein